MTDGFRGRLFFCSNFYFSPVVYEGIVYPTSEHAYQAAKATSNEDRMRVAVCNTPGQAKHMGQRLALPRDWDQVKLGVMLDVLVAKFDDSKMANMLRDTGDEYLEEINYWHDSFWGKCLCAKHKRQGSNWLGRLLIQTRGML